ncbi:uncharacterized protein LOC62_05G007570 [Vanrija pseudolonga]|uniref:Uncharacterized protein n=1 Tax=Vanrija pseudolonga TaxID=143232 RepID=A0AAF0YDQ1_9TREE|nr:hypothetical protein LOC62_05G007570 [Vanrija pseudolonga]
MPSSVSGLVAALQDGSAAPTDELATKLIRGWVYDRMRRGRGRIDVAYALDEVQSSIGLNKYEVVFSSVREMYQLPALGDAPPPEARRPAPPPPPPIPNSPRGSNSTASVIAALTEPHPGRPRNLNGDTAHAAPQSYAAGVLRAYIGPRLARSTPQEMGRRLDAIERVMEFEERRFEHAFIAVRHEFQLPDSTVFAEHASQKVGSPSLPPGAAPAVLARPTVSRQHSSPSMSASASPSPPQSYAFPPPLPRSGSPSPPSTSASWDSRHSSPLARGPSPGPVPLIPNVHATPRRPSPPSSASTASGHGRPPLPLFEPLPGPSAYRHVPRSSLPTSAAPSPPVPPLSIGRSAGRALLQASASSTSSASVAHSHSHSSVAHSSIAHSHSPDLSVPSSTPSTSPSTPSITPPTPSVATLSTPPSVPVPRPPTPPRPQEKPERGFINNLLFPRSTLQDLTPRDIPDLTPRDIPDLTPRDIPDLTPKAAMEPIPDLTPAHGAAPRLALPDLTQRLQLPDFGDLADLTPRAADAQLRPVSPAPPVPPPKSTKAPRARIPEPEVESATPPPVAFEATASALPPANTGPLPASHPFARALHGAVGRRRSDSTGSSGSAAPSTKPRDSEASAGGGSISISAKVTRGGYGDLDVVALRRVHERRVGEAERLVREAEDAARTAHEARRIAEDAARRADEAKGKVEEMRARLRRVEASVGLSS